MNQELIYKKNINKLMSLTNFEYDKVKNRPPGFHLDRVNFMMKKFGYPNKNQNFIHVAESCKTLSSKATIAHNFAHKYFYKIPWDVYSKVMREHVLSTTSDKKELYERIIDDIENQEDNPEHEEQNEDRVEVGSENESESESSESESD